MKDQAQNENRNMRNMCRAQFKQATRKNDNLKTLQDLDGEIWARHPSLRMS